MATCSWCDEREREREREREVREGILLLATCSWCDARLDTDPDL